MLCSIRSDYLALRWRKPASEIELLIVQSFTSGVEVRLRQSGLADHNPEDIYYARRQGQTLRERQFR